MKNCHFHAKNHSFCTSLYNSVNIFNNFVNNKFMFHSFNEMYILIFGISKAIWYIYVKDA